MTIKKSFLLLIGLLLFLGLPFVFELTRLLPTQTGHVQTGREVGNLLYHRFEVPFQAKDIYYKTSNINTWLSLSIEPEDAVAWCAQMDWKPLQPIEQESPHLFYDQIQDDVCSVKNGFHFNCIEHGKGYFGVYDADSKIFKLSFCGK